MSDTQPDTFDARTWAEATITDALNDLGPDPDRLKTALWELRRSVERRVKAVVPGEGV